MSEYYYLSCNVKEHIWKENFGPVIPVKITSASDKIPENDDIIFLFGQTVRVVNVTGELSGEWENRRSGMAFYHDQFVRKEENLILVVKKFNMPTGTVDF